MTTATFSLTGMRELDQALSELPKATGKNVCVRALTAGGEPIARAARARERKRTGFLIESTDVSTKLSRRQAAEHVKESEVEVFVGPGSITQAITEEFGTVNQAPHPFLRPAFDEQGLEALGIITNELAFEIDKAAARLARKAQSGR